jgi:hypothetical protein
MPTALEEGEGQRHAPAALYPRERLGTHFTGGWVDRFGQVRKISPPPGFDPRTVQPVASRYTDYATRPTFSQMPLGKSLFLTEYSGTPLIRRLVNRIGLALQLNIFLL